MIVAYQMICLFIDRKKICELNEKLEVKTDVKRMILVTSFMFNIYSVEGGLISV